MEFKAHTTSDCTQILSLSDQKMIEMLFEQAKATRQRYCGRKIYYRGLIEIGNRCEKDCFYCGIRKSNQAVVRYQQSEEEILQSAKWAYQNQLASIALQGGEIQSPDYWDWIEQLLYKIKALSQGELGITLSLGEQPETIYRRWFQAGATRYLLRIETSNEKLYQRLHPKDHSFQKRVDALESIKACGYQLGTGVMIGLPHQTLSDLVEDLFFFKKIEVDMVGMGPFIPHHQTPLKKSTIDPPKQLLLALKMIALTRLYLQDINIVASTALQTLHPLGKEMGIQAGANIIMPNITAFHYQKYYHLYNQKPIQEESLETIQQRMDSNLIQQGEEIGYGQWGDSPHFKAQQETLKRKDSALPCQEE